jgi:hypothetical protein
MRDPWVGRVPQIYGTNLNSGTMGDLHHDVQTQWMQISSHRIAFFIGLLPVPAAIVVHGILVYSESLEQRILAVGKSTRWIALRHDSG